MQEFLTTLLASLEMIEVKGKSNLNVLLGCMIAVEQMIAKIEAEQNEEENDG